MASQFAINNAVPIFILASFTAMGTFLGYLHSPTINSILIGVLWGSLTPIILFGFIMLVFWMEYRWNYYLTNREYKKKI